MEKPRAFDIALDGVANVAEASPGRAGGQPLLQAMARSVEQVLGFGGHTTGFHSDIHVAVKAILFNGNVNGENVPLLQDAVAGDAVDDFVVDGDADAAGKAAVAQGTGNRPLAADVAVGYLVEVEGGDPGREGLFDAEHGFGGNAATGADAVDFQG